MSDAPVPTGPFSGLTRLDHVGIACRDLDASIEFYRRTYGFEVEHQEVNEEQGVREAMLLVNGTDDGGATYIQLLEPTRDDSPYRNRMFCTWCFVHLIFWPMPIF